MARPEKSTADKHDVRLTTRFTQSERERLDTVADAYGITLSEYIRRQALNVPMPPLRSKKEVLVKIHSALIRLGVNLNQIARVANIKEKVLANMLYELIVRIDEKLDELDRSL